MNNKNTRQKVRLLIKDNVRKSNELLRKLESKRKERTKNKLAKMEEIKVEMNKVCEELYVQVRDLQKIGHYQVDLSIVLEALVTIATTGKQEISQKAKAEFNELKNCPVKYRKIRFKKSLYDQANDVELKGIKTKEDYEKYIDLIKLGMECGEGRSFYEMAALNLFSNAAEKEEKAAIKNLKKAQEKLFEEDPYNMYDKKYSFEKKGTVYKFSDNIDTDKEIFKINPNTLPETETSLEK